MVGQTMVLLVNLVLGLNLLLRVHYQLAHHISEQFEEFEPLIDM